MKITLIFVIAISLFVKSCKDDKSTLNDGLIAYYPFNGNANDNSGNNHHGIVHRAQLISDRKGNTNSAYSFNGDTNYIDIGNSSDFKHNTSDYSVTFWLNLHAYSPSYCSIILSNRNKSSYSGSMIEIAGELSAQYQQVIFYKNYLITEDSASADFLNSGDFIHLNQWYFIGLTYDYNGADSNFVRIYINNQLTASRKIGITLDPDNEHTFLGCEPEKYPIYSLDGILDEVRIYNRVLSENEIAELYTLN